VVNGGYIYNSSDYGATWTARKNDITRAWQAISSSALGDKLIAVLSSTNYIYTSTDYGVTWSEIVGNGLVSGLTLNDAFISADGSKLVAGDNYGYIYTSSDNGVNWLTRTSAGSRVWQSIVSSADGSKIVAVDNGGYIYNSLDSGASWVEQTSASTGTWQSVAASTDGSVIAVVSNPGYIYIYRPGLPIINSGSSSSITSNGATLSGDIVNTNGINAVAEGFEYGVDTSYGKTVSASGSYEIGSFSNTVSGLNCGTTYHYRAYATNNFGSGYGSDQTFNTAGCASAPFVLPSGIGSGLNDESIAMNATRDINQISTGGVNLLAYIGAQANFKTPKSSINWQLGDYSLKISDLDLATNIITLKLDSQNIILQKGESKEIDLDGDKINDLKLTFANIYVNRAEITIKSLKGEVAVIPVVINPITPVVVVNNPVITPVNTTVKTFVFTRDLKLNSVSADVKELQKLLNAKGYIVAKTGAGSKGKETNTFGSATKAALIKFQKANKINPASGLFGPMTRKVINGIK